MFDFTGTAYSFSVAAEAADVYELDFTHADGQPFDLSGSAFEGRLVREDDGSPVDGFSVYQAVYTPGLLRLDVPALSAGRYRYEVVAGFEDGSQVILLRGVVTALSRAEWSENLRAAAKTSVRGVTVVVPEAVGDPLTVRMRGSSYASMAAQEAAAAAEAAEAAKEAAAEAAAAEADRARDEANRARDEADKVESLVRRVELLEGVIAKVEGEIRGAILVNPETNTWWVGGVDLGVRATGEPGKAPRVSDHNTWEVWDEEARVWRDTGMAVEGAAGFSPYVGSRGFWIEKDPITGEIVETPYRAIGRDGIDGVRVRRHIISSPQELPQEGVFCNGGHYFYVPHPPAWPVAIIEVGEARGEGMLRVNEANIELASARISATEAAGVLAARLEQAFPDAEVQWTGVAVTIRADVPAWCFDGLPDGYKLTQHVRMPRKGFDVYAWLERGDEAAWVCVGEANDIATREVYGLNKLGTDVPVDGGAPVGVNDEGQMSVPRSEWAVPGVTLPGVNVTIQEGGAVGFDASGRMFTVLADRDTWGSVRTSFSGMAEVAAVGKMADGRLGLPWATLHQPGAIKLGSEFGQSCPQPYIQGVGATEDHQLANNFLFGGALQHMRRSGWVAKTGMAFVPGIPKEFLSDDQFYSGLVTSAQFKQSSEVGLELVSGAEGVLGGVYVTGDITDERADAVLNAAAIKYILDNKYFTKEDLYPKGWIDLYFLTKKEADNKYQTVEGGNEAYTKIEKKIIDEGEKYVKKTDMWTGEMVLTEREYNELEIIDPTIKYTII